MMFAQTSKPAPITTPVTTAVTPKETLSSVKLALNRSQYSDTQKQFNQQVQAEYYQKVKPVLDGLDHDAQKLIDVVKAENGWDDSYTFDSQTGVWSVRKIEKK